METLSPTVSIRPRSLDPIGLHPHWTSSGLLRLEGIDFAG
jgi:hypothetical protein